MNRPIPTVQSTYHSNLAPASSSMAPASTFSSDPANTGVSMNKLTEIFMTASHAFQKLGDLTMQVSVNGNSEEMKWTEKEAEQLSNALSKFAQEMEEIHTGIKARASKMIRTDFKRRTINTHTRAGMAVANPCVRPVIPRGGSVIASGMRAPSQFSVVRGPERHAPYHPVSQSAMIQRNRDPSQLRQPERVQLPPRQGISPHTMAAPMHEAPRFQTSVGDGMTTDDRLTRGPSILYMRPPGRNYEAAEGT